MHAQFEEVFKAYPVISGTVALSPDTGAQLLLSKILLHNGSNSAIDVAILKKYNDVAESWKAFSIDDSESVDATDITEDMQNAVSTDIFAANDDGFMIQSTKQFNFIIPVATQATTGSPVWVYEYWNGSAWTALPVLASFATNLVADGTSNVIIFATPLDWVVGSDAATGGSLTQYSIKVTASTAPSQVAKFTGMIVGEVLAFQEALADKAKLELSYSDGNLRMLEAQEAIAPYFSTAAAANLFEAFYASH